MNNCEVNVYKEKIFTIPNILSFFRLLLIPFIIWLYIGRDDYFLTLILLLVSGATDIVDGFIARKYKMISDFGKALDPIADKLTQISLLVCLVSRFKYMFIPLALLIVKEFASGITCLVSIKKTKKVESAAWHGKLTTVVLYCVIAVHLIWYNITESISLVLIGICIGIMIMSFIMYLTRNIKNIKN